eukprot:TRINITY_DN10313_c0_g1_i1.p3 TRINITY_DN10313_c0_g1~~TRINITY_DN10313_c0_g1_i1.p3  ORF type:complete len:101 (+),score=55.33 TRINITY_DN10313_c0_g1_i1:32-304(+)
MCIRDRSMPKILKEKAKIPPQAKEYRLFRGRDSSSSAIGFGYLEILFEKGPEAVRDFSLLIYKEESYFNCLLYTSPSPRDLSTSRMPSSA